VYVAAGSTSYTFTNLVAGAIYQYRITAVNTIWTTNKFHDDILNFSDGTSHIVALVPGLITNLAQQAFDYEKGSIKLIWTAPAANGSPIKYYQILRDVGSGVFYPLAKATDIFYTDTDLVIG